MTKIKISYDKNKCVGQGNCAKIDPVRFIMEGDKAVLLQAIEKDGVFELEGDFDGENVGKIAEAGESCPVNAIGVFNVDENSAIVTTEVELTEAKEIKAVYDDEKEFVLDSAGYFLIKINKEASEIEVGFCDGKNKLVLKVSGKRPIDIYHTILHNEKLAIRPEHAAYLGRELQKAYIALQKGLEYVQDDELNL